MELKGRTALVTGSAKRVGREIALALAARGSNIAVHYRKSKKEAASVVRAIRAMGADAFAFQADLESTAAAGQLVRSTVKKFGSIDILVNSASAYFSTPFERVTEKDWDTHMDTNLKGVFFVSQEAGIRMRKQKRGKILNIIDAEIGRPYPGYLPYLVSKSGLHGLTLCLAKELAPHVQVNAVSPGAVLFPENWNREKRGRVIRSTPLQRAGSPKDIANAVIFCVESDYMTGAVIPVDGGRHIR
jgi:NAD(P)-dependent dehydrogenase (short-subunit alcohol dehydrogenase family)